MKRTFTRFVMTMLLLMVTVTTWAYDVEVDGIYYDLYNNGTENIATVTYFTTNSYSGDVAIPESIVSGGTTYSVTGIGERAFYYCTGLTSIGIPNSVTYIGESAFYNCSGLTSVTIPSSVTGIYSKTFQNCQGLLYVNIPNSVTMIGDCAFNSCCSLKSITIPNSVTSIGECPFLGCYFIKENFINNCSSSGVWGWGETIVDVEQEDGLLIKNNIAVKCRHNATSVTIPNSVTSIGESAFYGCTGLTSVTIGNSVTSIGERAFYNCYGLTSITIPNSVTSIGYSVFSGCAKLTSAIIPNSVTSIGSNAFYNCTGLTSVTIGSSVTSFGESAFGGCHLRTIISKREIPYSTEIFTDTTYMHAQLYVPEGSYWDYAYSAWYKFNNIKEFAASEDNVRDGAVYMIADEAGMNYKVYNARTNVISNVEYTFALDDEDEGTCWQVVENGSDKYLYNIGAKAYAALNN